jgi:enamine deaminase RidA (YjgF/YER057c/UK114 family)
VSTVKVAGSNPCRLMLREPDAMVTDRQRVPAVTAWANQLAYSRAVKVGAQVFVSGTLPVDAQGQLVGGADVYLQTRQVLKLILGALDEVGARASDVVRLRIYLRDYADFPEIARAQFEVFDAVRPTCTFVQTGFVSPEFRVQMDADAIIEIHPSRATA